MVKKTDYATTIPETEQNITDHYHSTKYITALAFNKLTEENFAARLKQADSATNADIDDLVERTGFDDKLKNLNKKVTSNKTKDSEAEK